MKQILLSLFFTILLALPSGSWAEQIIQLNCMPERGKFTRRQKDDIVVKIDVTSSKVVDHSRPRKRLPLNLAIVLDRSGSMQGEKIVQARQAACMAVDQLNAEDVISLIAYDDSAEVLIPSQPVGNKERLKAKINKIQADGSTAIYDGIKTGVEEMDEYLTSKRVNRVLLLSDGMANVGPSQPGDFRELGRSLRRRGIAVTTIGLGDDYNEDLMIALAEASDANYYYVRDTEKLPGIFSEELRLLKSIVARNVRIVITVPKGVRPIEIMGYPEYSFNGQVIEIPIAEFTTGQTREFFLRCSVPESRAPLKVVDVKVEYDDEIENKQASLVSFANVAFTASDDESDKSINGFVAKPLALTRSRLAKERAVILVDQGRGSEAAKVLREQRMMNAAAPAPAQSEALAADSDFLDQKAQEAETTGSLSKASRKDVKSDNYNKKYSK